LHRELSDKPGEAATWDSLGYIRHQMGNHGQAVDCYQHALEIYEEGGHRYYQADTFTHMADVKQAAGDLDAARDAWQRALAILDDLGHPDAERVRANLA
jgi:tetratricopeptide (TPR) repeat protein